MGRRGTPKKNPVTRRIGNHVLLFLGVERPLEIPANPPFGTSIMSSVKSLQWLILAKLTFAALTLWGEGEMAKQKESAEVRRERETRAARKKNRERENAALQQARDAITKAEKEVEEEREK